MSILDPRVPAVLLRLDRNPFHHGTLGAVRSLGRAGAEVHVVADCAASPVPHSRYLHRTHRPPPPDADPAAVTAVLRRVAAALARPAVLIPLDDAGAIAVSRAHRELTGPYLLPGRPGALAERVADKARLAEVCRALGIPHPRTVLPGNAAEAGAAAERLGLPVVAKWSRPWLVPGGSGLRSTLLLRSAAEAAALYRRSAEAGSPLLLQTYLAPGPGRDWFFHGYADRNGALHGGGSGCKRRAWPPRAGATAVGRWVPNPRLHTAARELVRTLGYRGVLDLDFRHDPARDAYHLLDFNPRPGAQFRLFADGRGIDVVRALHLDLTGRPLPDAAPLPGRRFVVENHAPLAALTAPLRSGPAELAWCARDDPGPARALALLWPRHAVRRLAARLPRPGRAPAVSPAPPPPPTTDAAHEKASSR
ncbi:ATP-grasp domain-containing protein [Streptomyces sp. NPDC002490]|uniref:carboxylate--amine ligase n=1 Tax=Streptomyces sp. NPDC002490 TaxID=3154416 RepID=UPI00332C891D